MREVLNSVLNWSGMETEQITYVVCFPRSGHHAMIGFLSRISDYSAHYCEFYNCTRHNGVEIECPNKGIDWRRKQFRCGAGNRILKNHDFKLNLPYSLKNRFIIQYRHPFYSIRSWYELEMKNGVPVGPWPDFLRDKMLFWVSFMKKWVVSHGSEPNVLLVPYDSLVERETLARIAGFSGLDNFDVNKLSDNHFKSFRQIEEGIGLNKNLESEILDLLGKANIAPLFHL